MPNSLKDYKLALFGLIAANVAFYYAVVQNKALIAPTEMKNVYR